MSDSYTNLLYHIIFSTKDRRPFLTDVYETRPHDYIGGTIRGLGGISLEVNGTEDHVHVLAKLRPDKALSDMLRELKANASGWMHDVFPDLDKFSWQHGYGAFTVVSRMWMRYASTLRTRRNIRRRLRFAASSFSF
jgi:REP-associated tyrosine transposase